MPKLFEKWGRDQLDNLLPREEDVLADGRAAMTAYLMIQFKEMNDAERETTIEALLKYCELDTLAMVMLCEAWNHWIYN